MHTRRFEWKAPAMLFLVASVALAAGDDVGRTAQGHVHGRTKIWGALHPEIPGSVKSEAAGTPFNFNLLSAW
jgi:hypothetical protein